MLVPAGSPIFFLREHRFALALWLLGSVFIYVVYAANAGIPVIVDEFIIYILNFILDAQL